MNFNEKRELEYNLSWLTYKLIEEIYHNAVALDGECEFEEKGQLHLAVRRKTNWK